MPEEFPNAEDQLLKRAMALRPRLMAYVMSMLGNFDLAEDVVQNATIRIWQNRESFEPGTNFKAWCFETARRTALEAVRKQKRAPITLDEETIAVLAETASSAEGESAPAYSMDALHDCVAKLGAKARELLQLRYAQNLSCQRIAARRGAGVASIHVMLSRIRSRVRTCMLKSRILGTAS